MNIAFINSFNSTNIMNAYFVMQDLVSCSPQSFWNSVKNEFLDQSNWKQLNLPGIGIINRQLLKTLIEDDFLVNPLELPFIQELSIETIRQAKSEGLTSLHLAAKAGLLDWVETALHTHDVNAMDFNGQPPLNYAIRSQAKAVVHLLIVNGADPNLKTDVNPPPLEIAVEFKNVSIVKLLISNGAVDENLQALKKAIRTNQQTIISYLTEQHLKINFDNVETGQSLMHEAITLGKEKVVYFLLENGYDINCLHKNNTPLLQACSSNEFIIAQYLINHRANVNQVDNDGWSPLIYAITQKNYKLSRLLLDHPDIDINLLTNDKLSPLMFAISQEDEPIVRLLLEKNPDLTFIDKDGWGALSYAISKKNLRLVKLLLENSKTNLMESSPTKLPFLHVAVLNQSEEIISELLKYQVGPLQFDSAGKNALHHACEQNNLKIIQMLLVLKDEINVQNRTGETPLLCAAHNKEAFSLLLEYGADPFIFDETGWTAFHYACIYGYQDILEKIWMNEKLVKSLLTINGNTLLHVAVNHEQITTVAFLIAQGMDVNQKNLAGITPLNRAVNLNNVEIVKLLMENGANPNLVDSFGRTVWHYLNCHPTENKTFIQLLSSTAFSIIPNAQDKEGNTALHQAVNSNNRPLIEYLLTSQFDPNIENKDGDTAFSFATRLGSAEILQLLLENKGNIDTVNPTGSHLLCMAVMFNHLNCVKILFDFRATDFIDHRALKIALLMNHNEILCYILNSIFQENFKNEHHQPVFLQATKRELSHIVSFLLSLGMNANITNKKGKSALHYAAQKGSTEFIQKLMQAKAEVNLVQEDGWTPLHYAVSHQKIDAVSLLIENGADIHCLSRLDVSLLHLAAQRGNKAIFELLLQKGCDLTKKNHKGDLALHYAASQGSKAIVRMILERHPEQLNELGDKDNSPLHFATSNNHIEIVRYLIQQKANLTLLNKDFFLPYHFACINGNIEQTRLLDSSIHSKTPKNNNLLPIHFASKSNNKELVADLLLHNDINAVTNKGITPLIYASIGGKSEMVAFLLENGADPHLVSKSGATALYYAARNGRGEIVKTLLELGCNSELIDSNGWTFFHHAAYGGLTDRLQTLLQQNNHAINQITLSNDTALHLAASRGHSATIKLLLANNIDVSQCNREGFSAMHLAAKAGHVEVVKTLHQHGANLGLMNGNQTTPLHFATQYGRKDVVKYILEQQPNEQNKANAEGNLPLHIAAINGHAHLIKFFDLSLVNRENLEEMTPLLCAVAFQQNRILIRMLRHGVNPNLPNQRGVVPLHLAAWMGNESTVNLLLSFKANVNAVDQKGANALFYAAIEGQLKIINLLREKGCDITHTNQFGQNCFHLAILKGDKAVVNALELWYKDPYLTRTSNGSNALHTAVEDKNEILINYFIQQKKMDVNSQNQKGITPLHIAAKKSKEIIQKLLAYGANVNLRDNKGLKPIHHAVIKGNNEIVEELLNHHAHQLNTVTTEGNSSLHLAVIYNHPLIVTNLLDRGAKFFANNENITPIDAAIESQFEKIIQIFKKNKLDEVKYSLEINLRKAAWHCIEPLSINEGTIQDKKYSNKKSVSYIGGVPHYFFSEIAESIHSFAKLLPAQLSLDKAEILKTAFANNAHLLERHKNGFPLFIQSGFTEHHVAIMIWKNWFCICNRGAESKKNVEVFHFEEKRLTQEIINQLIHLRMKSVEKYKKALYDTLSKQLNFNKHEIENAVEKRFAHFIEQEKSNCAWKSTETCMAAYFVFDTLLENAIQPDMQLEAIKKSIKIGIERYNDWSTFMQNRSLQKLVQHSLQSDYEPDLNLIEECFALLRTQSMKDEIRSILAETESIWRQNGYASISPQEIDLLWVGDQTVLNNLSPVEKVRAIVDLINPQCDKSIIFNENKIAGVVTGGTCSALSLELAKDYLLAKSSLDKSADAETYRDCMRILRKKFRRSNKKMRIVQAAFNTIEVVKPIKEIEEIDYSRNKMQSLANYYGLKIDEASNLIYVSDEGLENLKEEMKKLSAGIYLVRQIDPCQNEKLETTGHSMIYVKEKNIGFFYDPNVGVKDLFNKKHLSVIEKALLDTYYLFGVTDARFYKLSLPQSSTL